MRCDRLEECRPDRRKIRSRFEERFSAKANGESSTKVCIENWPSLRLRRQALVFDIQLSGT